MVAMTSVDKGLSLTPYCQFHQGEPITEITPEQARAILDYDIVKEASCRPNGEVIEGQFHLVRPDHDVVIGDAVGSDFTADNNAKVFDYIMKDIVPAVPGMKIITVATCYSGATAFVDFQIGDTYKLPNDNSPQTKNLLFANAITKTSVSIGSHAQRILCCNTLRIAMKQTQFKVSHTKSMMNTIYCDLDSIKKELEQNEFILEAETFLANKMVTDKEVKSILDLVYPLDGKEKKALTHATNLREATLARFENNEREGFTNHTYWSLYNAIGYNLSHKKTTANRDGAFVELNQMAGLNAQKNGEIFTNILNFAKAA